MSDSASLTTLLAQQLMLLYPTPTNDFVQGLIRGCGLKTVLDSVVAIASTDPNIARAYTNDLILQNIPSDYFSTNNNVIENLLSSVKPAIEASGNVYVYNSANNSPRFANLTTLYNEISGGWVYTGDREDCVNLKLVSGWVGKQKINCDTAAKCAHLRSIIYTSYGKSQQELIGALRADATKVDDLVAAFNSLCSNVTFAKMKAAGFYWQEMLFHNQYISSLKTSFSLTVLQVIQFLGEQTSITTSQVPNVVPNSDITSLTSAPKSTRFVTMKVCKLLGFTAAEVLAEPAVLQASNYNETNVSNRAFDFDIVFDKFIFNKPLLERLAVFQTGTNFTPRSGLILTKDTPNAIYTALYENNGDGKLFTTIAAMTSTPSADYSAPSADSLKRGGIVKFLIENFSGNNTVAGAYGKIPIDVNSFFVGNADYKNLVASMFWYKASDQTIRSRGIASPFDTINNITESGDNNRKQVILTVVNNDSTKYLNIILSNTMSLSDSAAITSLLGLLDNQSYTTTSILNLEPGAWSNYKKPVYLLGLHASQSNSYVHAKMLFDHASSDLLAVRQAVVDLVAVQSSHSRNLVSILSFRNYSPATIKLVLSAPDNINAALAILCDVFVNDTNPDNINVYKQLCQEYGLSAFLNNTAFKVNGVKKIPAKPAGGYATIMDTWFFAFTSLADCQTLASNSESRVEDLVTHTVTTNNVSLSTGEISGSSVKKLLYSPSNLKTAFGVSDEEFADAVATTDLVPVV